MKIFCSLADLKECCSLFKFCAIFLYSQCCVSLAPYYLFFILFSLLNVPLAQVSVWSCSRSLELQSKCVGIGIGTERG